MSIARESFGRKVIIAPKRGLIVAALVVAICAVVGWVAYRQYRLAHQSLTQTAGLIRTTLPKRYGYLKADKNIQSTAFHGSIAYSVPGYDFGVSAPDTDLAYFSVADGTSQDGVAAALTTIASILRQAGFVHVYNPPIGLHEPVSVKDQAFGGPSAGFYEKNDVICLLGHIGDIELDCTSEAKLAAVAKAVQPFAAAYASLDAPASGRYDDPYFGMPQVKEGKVQGYKYALVPVGDASRYVSIGAEAYFYTDSRGSGWRYLLSSEEGFSCSEKLPADAAKAFQGVCNPTL